jgi:membrane-associated phospholipid phosphatase
MMLTRYRVLTAAAGTACLTVLIVVGLAVRGAVPGLDAWALRAAGNATGVVEQAATIISGVATLLGITALVVAAGIAWFRHRSAAYATLLRSGLLFVVCCLTVLLQDVFQRQGPTAVPDWSYPSGHVTIITAVALTAVVLSAHLAAPRRWLVWSVALVAVLLTAASRLALGEHFLTDVVGAVSGTVGVGLLAAMALGMLPMRVRDDEPQPVSP